MGEDEQLLWFFHPCYEVDVVGGLVKREGPHCKPGGWGVVLLPNLW